MATLAWTVIFVLAVVLFAWQIQGRLRALFALRSDDGRDYGPKTWSLRLKNMTIYGLGQKKFIRTSDYSRFVHPIIFLGFVVLFIQVLTMFGRGWSDDFVVPGFSIDGLGGPYAFFKDILEVVVLAAVLVAAYRWAVTQPQRLYGFLPAEKQIREKSHGEAYLILLFIALIMLSGLLYDAGRIVYLASMEEIELESLWQPISRLLAAPLADQHELAEWISKSAWWIHNVVVLAFLNVLPRSKHFHIITSLPNVFLSKLEPKGRLPQKDYTTENALFGRSQIPHFTWKQALDMYSCTECGRCSSQCPATATGKPLAPRQFLLNLRDSLYANQTRVIASSAKKSNEEQVWEPVVSPQGPVLDEVIWSCVECRACEEACPVNIEYVDKIVDIRQHLVQEASRFPEELNRAFKGLETQSNPWGISAAERMAWTEGLDVPLMKDRPDAEYLYYVGCGGSFDATHRKATIAFTKILKAAKISFAILGTEETCNGETARRLGNEYLFQQMAEQLVSTFKRYNVKKIIVNCPHCYNTLKNEYPQFGGSYELTHAAELVGRLVAEKKIQLKGKFGKKVVYHDSCYYGRFNGVFEQPRMLLNQIEGLKLEEMERSRRRSMCCGAGGGRMWMEEKADQRVNILRTDQALAKNPDVIATSCPYCRIMISSGINEKGLGDKIGVMDVMEVVAASQGQEQGTL
ncbi:MAG: (Fe-S)-binding protein [Deltaproteobacteria bacterium]|nr:(Fe-S)-binding protein [Deltaproteobacteria bacterium]